MAAPNKSNFGLPSKIRVSGQGPEQPQRIVSSGQAELKNKRLLNVSYKRWVQRDNSKMMKFESVIRRFNGNTYPDLLDRCQLLFCLFQIHVGVTFLEKMHRFRKTFTGLIATFLCLV